MNIQSYHNPDPGYKPILINEGWQIGHLNFMPELRADVIDRIERHNLTDEVFILYSGDALLTAAVETPEGLQWEVIPMQKAVTYNIPAGLWHTIAMSPGDVVLIVEKDGTHLGDVDYRPLSDDERKALRTALGR